MADRASLRSSSRRDTPQSPTEATKISSAPQRSTRATRSQSQDLHDGDAGASAVPNQRRSRRGASVESNASNQSRGNNNSGARQRATRARPIQDLPTVAEGASMANATLGSDGLREDMDIEGHENSAQRDPASPGGFSGISGTTARTSYSVQELADLDQMEMIDALPSLLEEATKMLDLLVPKGFSDGQLTNTIRQLQDPTSRPSKNLKRISQALGIQKEPFGAETYINISIAVRGILGVRRESEIGVGPWRLDGIYHKTNLALLVKDFLTHDKSGGLPASIEKIERDFPSQFIDRFVSPRTIRDTNSPASALFKETFEIALELRTQSAIALITNNIEKANFDPDVILKDLFLEPNDAVRGWDVIGLQSKDVEGHSEFRRLILEQIATIRESIRVDSESSYDGASVDIESLREHYPWQDFVHKLVLWSQLRIIEIDEHLSSVSGVDGIVETIQREFGGRPASPELPDVAAHASSPLVQLDYNPSSDPPYPMEEAEASRPGTLGPDLASIGQSRLIISKGTVSNLKQIVNKVHADQVATIDTRSLPANAPAGDAVSDSQARDFALEEEPSEINVDREIISKVRQLEEQAIAEGNKENIPQRPVLSGDRSKTLLDRQAGAKRVSWDSQQSTQNGEALNSGQKRARADDEDPSQIEISEDEGFQEDNRVEFSRNRPTDPSSNPQRISLVESPRKRSRVSRTSRGLGTNIDETGGNTAEPSRSSEPERSQAKVYEQVNRQSKNIEAICNQKRIQTRRPWSTEEIEVLIQLVQEVGTSWTAIKKRDANKDNILEHRDQVALKDKCRNMKMDYMKGGHELPVNFNHVALSEPQKKKLRQLGKYAPSSPSGV